MARKRNTSNNDTRVAAIVIGLFVAVVILVLVFSKAKEKPGHENPRRAPQEYQQGRIEEQETEAPTEASRPLMRPKAVGHRLPRLAPRYESADPFDAIQGAGGRIAFILDDWGYTMANCKYLREIPEPLAISILPGLRHTKDIAVCANTNHKVAMLHLPLEAVHNSDFYPPNYIIKTSMNPDLVVKIVEGDLNQLPTIEGVNNHMGSKATADRGLMRTIFNRIKRRNLFWVDSVTSRYSVSADTAGEMGIPYAKRDVFLDDINTREAIIKQMVSLAQKARRRGYAVAIGHDRPLTMQILQEEIPMLEAHGFHIVSIKSLLKRK